MDLAPGETYKDLGNVRADELATRAMWSGDSEALTIYIGLCPRTPNFPTKDPSDKDCRQRVLDLARDP